MRKFFLCILCVCACMSAAACGNKGGENPAHESVSSQNGNIELPEDKFD